MPLEIYFDAEKTQKVDDETFLDVMEFLDWTPDKGALAEYTLYNPNPAHVFLLRQMNGQSIFEFTAVIPDSEGKLHKTELGSVSHPEAILPQESVKLILEIKPVPAYSELTAAELAFYANHELMIRFEIKNGKVPIFPVERYRVWKMTTGRSLLSA